MKQQIMSKLLVFGVTGGIGKQVFHHLEKTICYKKFEKMYTFSRSKNSAKKAISFEKSFEVEYLEGDLTDLKTISQISSLGITHVIFAAGGNGFSNSAYQIDYVGVTEILQNLKDSKLEKFVYISSVGVTGFWRPLMLDISLVNYGKWKKKTEELIQQKVGNYTIIRPGMLTDEKRTCGIEFSQKDDMFWYSTSRDSVAEACVMSLFLDDSKNKIFEINDDKKSQGPQGEDEWRKVFQGFK